MDWYTNIKRSDNPKVIAMLSGGKDSAAAVIMLKKHGIDITAIHFVHNWSSSIATEEAKRICELYEIPLIVKDYTKEFCAAVNGYTAGRPCLLCKKQMYHVLLSTVSQGDFGWLCIGDNANDRTTIARIKQYIESGHLEESLNCSGYFGSEMGIKLHDGMKVLRPLIEMTIAEIEQFLKAENVVIRRMNSTGDKYFEYHREGCPIQFADIGVHLDKKLYSDLKKYNECITEFARKEGILASIHMPSTFIITIPRGYEEKAANYLKKKGLPVDCEYNSQDFNRPHMLFAFVHELNRNILDTNAYKKIFNRLLERLELYEKNVSIIENESQIYCAYTTSDTTLDMHFNFENRRAEIKYIFTDNSKGRTDKATFENLILELFRTRKYAVINTYMEA